MDMDDFSDDGFDDLDGNVLQELENNALQFTQAQKPFQSQASPPVQHHHQQYNQQQQQNQQQNYFDLDDDDLDDTVVIDELAPQHRPAAIEPTLQSFGPGLPSQNSRLIPSFAGQQRWHQQTQAPRAVFPPRPQYPAQSRPAPPPLSSQRYPPRLIPPSTRALPHRQSQVPSQSQFVRPPIPLARPYPGPPTTQALHGAGQGKPNDVVSALQARLSALEAELTAAKGEASILRSKYDKASLTHDAEVARLKKQSAEQAAKHERMVEAAMAAERTAATELQFARQDLKEELGRVKARKKDGATTPKKSKSFSFVPDGFDGVEVMTSPSKGQQAQKRKDSGGPTGSASAAAAAAGERTPSKGKRKRPAVDSPSFALETHSENVSFEGVDEDREPVATKVVSDTLPFDFLRLVLDHSQLHGQPLTFDLFSRFAFPSQPSQTFASIIFQKLPRMGNAHEPLRLLVDFAELMIDMWQQCLSERYHAPIYYLAALVSYTLQLNATTVAPHIISSLVPVCATTCRLVALPRFNSVDGNISDHPDNVVRQLLLEIDVTQSLALLYISAMACVSPPGDDSALPLPLEYSPQSEFWKAMELEFVMVMLSPKQCEPDWFGMLALLATSVLPFSIGPIPNPTTSAKYFANGRAETETSDFVANGIIDRVSSFLAESPPWALRGSAKEVNVRLSVLKTLIIFASSNFGAFHLANSDVAIPRLVTVLCWGIDRLYDVDITFTPSTTRKSQEQHHDSVLHESTTEPGDNLADGMDLDKMQVDEASWPITDADAAGGIHQDPGDIGEEVDEEIDVSKLLCRLIALAMFLIHTLVTDPRTANVVNMTAKLAASQGGSQRYLLTLARLNFAEEDLVLEKGIDAETVELAHELLELAVTPDEGEGVGELFGV
ncbi:hypothetical protein B0H66DRAFT_644387 [Apodospora peruviana]|uniref:DNA repair protein Rad26 n=1 Tax=Apodospora peruviana TaxID=516989 RepID=A0AAE0HSG0_9PEZI|nr:hypothetical protein B0H66DRAFT_644387 [Apodospora peruviana]